MKYFNKIDAGVLVGFSTPNSIISNFKMFFVLLYYICYG